MSITKKCAIKGCITYATSGISLHKFPREESMLLKWLKATNISCVSLHTVICALHFKQSDYINLQAKLRRLRSDAVPSLHLCHDHILDHEECNLEDFSEEDVDDHVSEETDSDIECNKNNIHSVVNTEEEQAGDDNCELPSVCVQDSDHDNTVSDIHKLMSLELSAESRLDSVVKEIKEEIKGVQTDTLTKESSCQTDVLTEESSCPSDKQKRTESYSFLDFIKTDSDLHAFTGINFNILEALVKSIKLIEKKVTDKHLCSLKKRIVLTLCKLRLGLSSQCLGVLFKISKSTVCNYFIETIHLLSCVLEEIVYFPDKAEIQENLPVCFSDFKDTRIILDCTEIAVQNSKCLQCRLKMYSHYKGKQTVKFLIGITPSGLISYCSKCYGGRASDKTIFLQSGLLDKLTPGEDAVMVDKGFIIKSECDDRDIQLIRPPFADKRVQMTKEDSLKTKRIAAARVHIERCIQRLKNYAFLKSTINWEMTKYIDEIMIIICGLVNLGRQIIDKSRFAS